MGTAGDVLPLLQVGRRLKARGHEVTLLTHSGFGALAAEAGLDFAALDDAAGHARSIEDGPLLNTPAGIPEFLRRHYFPYVPLEYDRIRERHRPSETVLVARDLFDAGARIAAEKLGIPVVWLFAAPSPLRSRELRHALLEGVLAPDIDAIRARLGLGPVEDWRAWSRYPGRSVGLWPAWFAPNDSSWAADVVPVGFILDNEGESDGIPEEIRAALDAGERPILITGGSGTFSGPGFYVACVEACRAAGRDAILVTPHDQLVPAGLPRTIRRYRHLPFGKLMPFVDAVVHHGGRGTMSCALAAGTPQVVLASGADRPDNATRLEKLGVAKYLPPPSWKAGPVANAIARLAGSPQVRERCREIAGRIAGTDSVGAACEVIEGAMSV